MSATIGDGTTTGEITITVITGLTIHTTGHTVLITGALAPTMDVDDRYILCIRRYTPLGSKDIRTLCVK